MKTKTKWLTATVLLLLTALLLSACGSQTPDILISFNTDGGSPVQSITLPPETPIALPEPPTRAGYTFGGWVVDGSQTVILDGYSFPAGTAAVILRAVWLAEDAPADVPTDTPEKTDDAPTESQPPVSQDAPKTDPPKAEYFYEVHFDSRGGSAVSDQYLAEGEPIHLGKNPTKDGYTFVTWEDKWGMPMGHGQEDADLELYVEEGDVIELFAVWEAK